MNVKKIFILALWWSSTLAMAQHPNHLVRKGNTAYNDSLFSESEQLYREALVKDQNSYAASFNLADAVYKQGNYSESSALFEALSEKSDNPLDKSKSYHNLGNSLIKEQKIDQAIEAYKNALRNKPDDQDTKFNLSYAQQLKQEQQKQEEQQEQEEENQDKEQEEEQQQDQEEQQQQEPQEEDEQNKSDAEELDKEKPKQPQDPNEMTEEEAQQILDALQQQEKELQEDLQKKKSKAVKLKILKDW